MTEICCDLALMNLNMVIMLDIQIIQAIGAVCGLCLLARAVSAILSS